MRLLLRLPASLALLAVAAVLAFGTAPGAQAQSSTSSATPSSATPSSATPSSATPSSATPSSATPSSATPSSATPSNGGYAAQIARVQYGGGGDWYSDEQSLPELLAFARQETLLDVAPQAATVKLSTDQLFSYPYLYLTGHGNVRLSPREVRRLRRYLTGGGFLHVDDNYGLDESIRRELEKVFPKKELRPLPDDHPIYRAHFDFPGGLPKIHEHDGKAAQGFGIFSDAGRMMVFYSYESDLGDGWEPASVHDNSEAAHRKALEMGANVLVYAMTR